MNEPNKYYREKYKEKGIVTLQIKIKEEHREDFKYLAKKSREGKFKIEY